jgi:predicted transglutaminase-like cysteine proteinase
MFDHIKTIAAAILATMLVAGAASAAPVDFSHPAFAPVAGSTSVPIGAAEFCKVNRRDCMAGAMRDVEALTDSSWAQLVAVNDMFNREITPITDIELYNVTERWAYPDGQGDCEDFALAKRRALIEMGWAPSTLLMTVVRQANGEGHAVLLVRTDRGDLVLDNQDGRILLWNDTPYEFIKRQSQTDPRKWVGISDPRIVVASTR